MDNLWFDDLRAVLIGDCFNIVFSRDIIICGWLGSKYQLTNYLSKKTVDIECRILISLYLSETKLITTPTSGQPNFLLRQLPLVK